MSIQVETNGARVDVGSWAEARELFGQAVRDNQRCEVWKFTGPSFGAVLWRFTPRTDEQEAAA